MSWETRGTVTVTNNSTVVTGLSTLFVSKSRVGDAFVGPDMGLYEITNIASDTVLSISPPYAGVTVAGAAYKIAPLQGYLKLSADRLFSITNTLGGTVAVVDGLPGWLKNNTPAPVTSGGTGAETASAARQNLGLKAAALLEVGSGAGTVAAGDDSRIVGAAAESSVASRLSTKVETTDTRLSNSREWKEPTATQAEAEAGEATLRRAWTAQRIKQAFTAFFNSLTTSLSRNILSAATPEAARTLLELGDVATKTLGSEVMPAGLGFGSITPTDNTIDANNVLPGHRNVWSDGISESEAVALNLPPLGGDGTLPRSWVVECVGGTASRSVQTATEIFGAGTKQGRSFTRVKQDLIWSDWVESLVTGSYGFGATSPHVTLPTGFIYNEFLGGNILLSAPPDSTHASMLSVSREGRAVVATFENKVVAHTSSLMYTSDFPTDSEGWYDLRPHLLPPFYWDPIREGRNAHPMVRILRTGEIQLRGTVSFNEVSDTLKIGVLMNLPPQFRPRLTSGSTVFGDTADPIHFGPATIIVTGEDEYANHLHGDVFMFPGGFPTPAQGATITLDQVRLYRDAL